MLEFGSSGEQQRSHARAWCRTTKSGLATRRRVSPAWPSWPPLALPDLPRRLRGARGFFFNPSLEGGFELFVLSSPSRRRSSATKASSSAIRRSFEASNSWISGGMTIPLLIQIRRTLSPKIRQPRPVSTNLWQFGLTTTWELRNFPTPEPPPASRAPVHQMLWVRGFRGHTISGRGFNLFKALRRHFRATPVLPSSPLAPRSRGPKRLGSKDRQSARRSPPGRPWELRNFRGRLGSPTRASGR